ncbi:MAG: dUTP diphosphatase [Candidatus Njordarchaeales archaeon]
MQVKIKKLHPDAVVPKYAKEGDAGLDLTAISAEIINENGCPINKYGTGLAFEIPDGHVGMLFCRSSVYKKHLALSNAVGILDSKFRGEVFFMFRAQSFFRGTGVTNQCYEVGDRIGQIIIIPYPQIEFVESEELSETERGAGGFGSSGR